VSTGIVCGTVLDAAKNPVSARVVLDHIVYSGQERMYLRGMQADGLRIQARDSRVGCPPYGIAAETNSDGAYVMLYDWAEDFVGEIAAQLRFRVLCFDRNDPQYPFLGFGVGIGIYGLDLRAMLSQATRVPFEVHSATSWQRILTGAMGAFPSRHHRPSSSEGTVRRERSERGIPYTPQGAPRTTPPGPVPRPPPVQSPRAPDWRGPTGQVRGAAAEPVGGGRYMLLAMVVVNLSPKGQEAARRQVIGGWPR
jgi:hypothetical protein